MLPNTLPVAWHPSSNRRRRPVRLVACIAFVSVVVGFIVKLWGGSNELSGAANQNPKLPTSLAGDLPHLVVGAMPCVLQSEEVATLDLTVDGTAKGAELLIGGFASGSLFSVGRAIGQNARRVPASEIETVTIKPPRGFVGAMDIVVTLALLEGGVADRGVLHLEWLPAISALPPSGSSTSHRLDAAELKALLARGHALETIGDLAGARLVFQRAAEAGNAGAAFRLAETYDPVVLEKLGELGLASDVITARVWYRKAKNLGSEEAPGRLDRLAHLAD